ncbi:hypothetical protein [Oribacterium sp. P6A1]|uniref:hypothetical protein n=1 Tax=Oribacterium sp. P6A1 TaxID=1410612 RepID=UPI000563A5FB|nr:hypothetical protein [Oribacterium sp. P6A1]
MWNIDFSKELAEKVTLLFRTAYKYPELISRRKNSEYICRIKNLLTGYREYRYRDNDSSILIVYPHDFFTKNHFSYYYNFISYFDKYDAFYYAEKKGSRRGVLKSLLWVIRNMPKVKGVNYQLGVMAVMSNFPIFLEQWERIDLSRYKLVVVYNELSPIGRYIVESCKERNIKTATLQHGYFCGAGVDKNEWNSIELSQSVVDYFLMWNNFTKSEAIRSGMKKEKIIVAGMPGYIGKCFEIRNTDDRSICIFLGSFDDDNSHILAICKRYAEIHGYKYYVRYHHGTNNLYRELFDSNYAGTMNEISIQEIVGSVEFSVCVPSSVFIEVMIMGGEIYRMGSNNDTLGGTNNNVFIDEVELDICRNNWTEIKKKISIEMLPPDDQEERYRIFFDQFDI